ncbi:MAG: penicillin-binding transpeptidase domain-containing protein, partial [Pyrinomonadaceae bacterium]
ERARQAAIARAIAIARQRAADQALRDEAAANILKDDTTGEDLEVRRAAVEALGNRAGTVVVMDPKTGRVYTVVNQEWAIHRGFKPCSTTKLVTGLAGLSEHVIDPAQTVNIGLSSFSLDLTDSLAFSNNGYFQRVGGEVGFDHMMEYARKLGLGQPTGINYAAESPGRLPVFKQGYAVNHMSSHGDDIEITPVQLANLASTIANGGHLLTPHLPRTPEENVKFKREERREAGIPQENLQRMLPGMIGAVNYGTAKLAYDATQTIAGKTGSCIGQGSWLGLFTSFAPVHDPKLAIAVVTRGSGERGKYAAGVAGKVYRALNTRFGVRPGSTGTPMLATDMLAPRPHIDPRKAAVIADEEREDEASGDAFVVSEANGAATSVQNNATGAGQSNVQKTAKTYQRPANTSPRTTPTMMQSAPQPEQKAAPLAERPRRVTPDNR